MSSLKEKFQGQALPLRDEIRTLLKENGSTVIDQVVLKQAYGGARGIKTMVWETSSLDPIEGIRFRGYSIPQLRELLPTAPGGKEPLPEGLFHLMLVGEIPTKEEVDYITNEWEKRSEVPAHTFQMLDNLPMDTHPMTQFILAITSMQTSSVFAKQYFEGLSKADHWDPTFEDVMNLIARLPRIAAYIYRRTYHNGDHIAPDNSLDWSANFAHMLGFDDPDFVEFMRLYLTIHADHEGGNASAHTAHLVGSTLSDAYLSFASGMNALAGPLHGLANQEVIKWIFEMIEKLGTKTPTKDQIREYVNQTLAEGKVIPGYGHAVLREPDPRFTAQKTFAKSNITGSEIVNVVWDCFDVIPEVLKGLGKAKNPWPNVDAHSGAILVHYGLDQFSFYTVLFGVSRALGVLAQQCWSRALGFPLERPKSITTAWVKDMLAEKKKEATV